MARTSAEERSKSDPRFIPNRGQSNQIPDGLSFRKIVAEDFQTHDSDITSEGFWALFWHRFGNRRMDLPKPLRVIATAVYFFMAWRVRRSTGIFLPYTVRVGRRVKLEHFGGMILVAQWIGSDVVIRQNTTFGIANMHGLKDRPVIGHRVQIGAGAVIVGSVMVGDEATIGANAVVVSDIPAGATAAGVPAKVIKIGNESSNNQPIEVV